MRVRAQSVRPTTLRSLSARPPTARRSKCEGSLAEDKTHFDDERSSDGAAGFGGRFEVESFGRRHGGLVEAVTETLKDARADDVAVFVDRELEPHDAFDAGAASAVRVRRPDARDDMCLLDRFIVIHLGDTSGEDLRFL